MANWAYAPDYRLRLTGWSYDTRGQRQSRDVWSLRSVQQIQALLTTGQGVGQLTATIADPDGMLAKHVQPRPMQLVELFLTNRAGESGIAWTGYVDSVHRAFDPQQGDHIVLTATSPVKLFEITSQTPGDAGAIAIAYSQNVTGSAVLKYAARACGYPASMLRIHPQADSGSGYQALNQAIFTTPDQQKWSSVVSAIQANSGLEWFFDEAGYCYWRPVGFINPWFGAGYAPRPKKIGPRAILEDDILQADFVESDQGVVTRVEVRYPGTGGIYQTAATWHAPTSMENHLRTRLLVVYAPWIYGANGAQYLAGVLGAQYASGVATASVTIPADPLIGVGSLVTVPALGLDGTTTYYVSSVTYQLAWGGSWVMTLGLSYGRHPNQEFPYVARVNYPVLTDAVRQDLPSASDIQDTLAPENPRWSLVPRTIVTNRVVAKNQAAASLYNPGALIQVWSKARSHGRMVGPSSNGEYTVVAPLVGQAAGAIALASASVTTAYVTIIDPSSDATNNPDQGGTTGVSGATGNLGQVGTGDHTAGPLTTPASVSGSSTQIRALNAAFTRKGLPYVSGHAGNDGWDCIGLVAWAYAQVGVSNMFLPNYYPPNNADTGPQGAFAFFTGLGATPFYNMDEAQGGDLLFVHTDVLAYQNGYVHICFALGNDQQFGSNNPTIGICTMNVRGYLGGGFTTDSGLYISKTPINVGLHLSTVQWGRR